MYMHASMNIYRMKMKMEMERRWHEYKCQRTDASDGGLRARYGDESEAVKSRRKGKKRRRKEKRSRRKEKRRKHRKGGSTASNASTARVEATQASQAMQATQGWKQRKQSKAGAQFSWAVLVGSSWADRYIEVCT